MRTRDRLATELRAVAAKASTPNAAKYEAFAKRAETGEFDDFVASDPGFGLREAARLRAEWEKAK